MFLKSREGFATSLLWFTKRGHPENQKGPGESERGQYLFLYKNIQRTIVSWYILASTKAALLGGQSRKKPQAVYAPRVRGSCCASTGILTGRQGCRGGDRVPPSRPLCRSVGLRAAENYCTLVYADDLNGQSAREIGPISRRGIPRCAPWVP
jgi:hypothetical protein